MTAIVRMLESEEGFDKIVHDILKEACEYLGISAAVLFRENIDGTTVNMISEYCSGEGWYEDESGARQSTA